MNYRDMVRRLLPLAVLLAIIVAIFQHDHYSTADFRAEMDACIKETLNKLGERYDDPALDDVRYDMTDECIREKRRLRQD